MVISESYLMCTAGSQYIKKPLKMLQGSLGGFGGDFVVPSYRGSSFLDPKVCRCTLWVSLAQHSGQLPKWEEPGRVPLSAGPRWIYWV